MVDIAITRLLFIVYIYESLPDIHTTAALLEDNVVLYSNLNRPSKELVPFFTDEIKIHSLDCSYNTSRGGGIDDLPLLVPLTMLAVLNDLCPVSSILAPDIKSPAIAALDGFEETIRLQHPDLTGSI